MLMATPPSLVKGVHRSIVDKHGLPKTPSELMPPFEDALDVLFQDLRKDTESQGFVENEEKWVQSGLWYRVSKESQKAWMVRVTAHSFHRECVDAFSIIN